MQISMKELDELTSRAVRSFGYRPDEVLIIKDVLLYAQLRNNNQGVVKLIGMEFLGTRWPARLSLKRRRHCRRGSMATRTMRWSWLARRFRW